MELTLYESTTSPKNPFQRIRWISNMDYEPSDGWAIKNIIPSHPNGAFILLEKEVIYQEEKEEYGTFSAVADAFEKTGGNADNFSSYISHLL